MVFGGKERKALAIGPPARAVAVLIGDKYAFGLLDGRDARRSTIRIQRDDPDVGGLFVRGQIHIDSAEQHPLAVRRGHGLADAFQLHHVFESEGMLALGECGKSEKKNEKKSKTAHGMPPRNKRV